MTEEARSTNRCPGQRGAVLVEYILIVTIVVLGLVVISPLLEHRNRDYQQRTANEIGGEQVSVPGLGPTSTTGASTTTSTSTTVAPTTSPTTTSTTTPTTASTAATTTTTTTTTTSATSASTTSTSSTTTTVFVPPVG